MQEDVRVHILRVRSGSVGESSVSLGHHDRQTARSHHLRHTVKCLAQRHKQACRLVLNTIPIVLNASREAVNTIF